MKPKTILFALYGKSGAGKDTVLENLLLEAGEGSLRRVVRTTSRPRRSGEVHGVDYNFIDQELAKEVVASNFNDLLEYNVHREWSYFTTLTSLSEDLINIGSFSEVAVDEMIQTARFLAPELVIFPIEITAPTKKRLLRALNRSTETEEVIRRFYMEEQEEYAHGIVQPCYRFENDADISTVDFSQLYKKILETALLRGGAD